MNKMVLRCDAAPVPSTVLWENLEYSKCKRFTRRIATTLFTALLCVLSAVAVFLSMWARFNSKADLFSSFNKQACPDVAFINLNETTPQGLALCYCDEFLQRNISSSNIIDIFGQDIEVDQETKTCRDLGKHSSTHIQFPTPKNTV